MDAGDQVRPVGRRRHLRMSGMWGRCAGVTGGDWGVGLKRCDGEKKGEKGIQVWEVNERMNKCSFVNVRK